MDDAKPLLIIWHSRTGASQALAEAAASGAGNGASILKASNVQSSDLLCAQGYIFVCPENLASMSGEMKEMFDRCYYAVLGKIEGKAYATIIAAGSDGEGAQRQIDRIATGWRLKRVAKPMIVITNAQSSEPILAPKVLEDSALNAARELGESLSKGLQLRIF